MRILVLPHREDTAANQMATDAGLRMLAGRHESLYFRFYSWSRPAWTIGYSQSMKWARSSAGESLEIVRRETGGGVVDHRHDQTYALAIPRAHDAWASPPAEIYSSLHATLAATWQERGLEVAQAPCRKGCGSPAPQLSHCFSAPAPNDVILSPAGPKLAGAAMRRHSQALLLQGSIERHPLLTMLDDPDWQRDWMDKLAGALKVDEVKWLQDWPEHLPDPKEVARFHSTQWNFRR